MSLLMTNKTQVSILSAGCLLALVVILKNIVNVDAPTLSRDVVWYIVVYSAFSLFYPEPKAGAPSSSLDRPVVWGALMVLLTAAIVLLYAW